MTVGLKLKQQNITGVLFTQAGNLRLRVKLSICSAEDDFYFIEPACGSSSDFSHYSSLNQKARGQISTLHRLMDSFCMCW